MTHRVVVVGGGFGGLPACRFLGHVPEVDVTLIDRLNHHLFQPLLYQVATGVMSLGHVAPTLRHVLRKYQTFGWSSRRSRASTSTAASSTRYGFPT
jgi:NADH dehydrogenase FAD-containing subunit